MQPTEQVTRPQSGTWTRSSQEIRKLFVSVSPDRQLRRQLDTRANEGHTKVTFLLCHVYRVSSFSSLFYLPPPLSLSLFLSVSLRTSKSFDRGICKYFRASCGRCPLRHGQDTRADRSGGKSRVRNRKQ